MAPTNNSWNSQDPAQVAKGGTGIATTTAYAPICGGTTATGAFQGLASAGSAGQVLTSNGTAALPTFQTASGSVPAGAQLMFFARLTSTLSDVTGDNTNYGPIVYDTADVNVGTCYNTGTGIFTAPTTGIYLFQASMQLQGIDAASTSYAHLLKNNTTAVLSPYSAASLNGTPYANSIVGSLVGGFAYAYPVTVPIGDQFYNYVQVTGVNKTSDIYGADTYTFWACYKITPAGENQFPWTEVTAASANLANNNGYIANRNSLVTLTLPTTSAVGSIIEIVGKGTGGWKVAQNANQMIHINAATSTTGTGGYISSNDQYNSVKLLCTVANLEFTVLSSEGTLNLN